jgi:hypothetical protein
MEREWLLGCAHTERQSAHKQQHAEQVVSCSAPVSKPEPGPACASPALPPKAGLTRISLPHCSHSA